MGGLKLSKLTTHMGLGNYKFMCDNCGFQTAHRGFCPTCSNQLTMYSMDAMHPHRIKYVS
jgi:rubrerythrin